MRLINQPRHLQTPFCMPECAKTHLQDPRTPTSRGGEEGEGREEREGEGKGRREGEDTEGGEGREGTGEGGRGGMGEGRDARHGLRP